MQLTELTLWWNGESHQFSGFSSVVDLDNLPTGTMAEKLALLNNGMILRVRWNRHLACS
ncbi:MULTISPECIES: hypothetical protein [Moorena]|nr:MULTISPECIES: hypothetical protein [Moorena]NEO11607.1 hypothetical protein [Moorena sp. SIO3E8]NEP99738.1 hypothetical protein [Moorena sp. SIO3F7]NEQ63558.1 hypothetical protein [Moorena sp. SIO4A1]